MIHDYRVGLKRFWWPHLLGFGVSLSPLTWYGGWGAAVVLVAWRGYEEYLDWHEGRDTLAKAVIDLVSQTAVAVIVATVRGA